MRKILVLFLSGLLFGACVGLVTFRAAEINFDTPVQESVSSQDDIQEDQLSNSYNLELTII